MSIENKDFSKTISQGPDPLGQGQGLDLQGLEISHSGTSLPGYARLLMICPLLA